MYKVDPKINAQSVAALIAAVVMTFVVAKFPGLKDLSEPGKTLIVAGVMTVIGWIAGYAKRGLDWAYKYVQDHETL